MRWGLHYLAVWLQLLVLLQGARLANSKQLKAGSRVQSYTDGPRGYRGPLAPKVFIINMFGAEGAEFLRRPSLGLYANNITVPGLSPLFPHAHCSSDGDVCEVITGEGEINAATSMMALTLSSCFDLRHTYFLIAGVAGVNPACGTTGSVCFSRFVVQVALQYEIDPRELPSNYTTGYIPLGAVAPGQYPPELYGTEAFELNKDLHDRAIDLASKAKLKDSKAAQKYRSQFPETLAASQPPSVFAGATATSDNWFSGKLLGDTFANFTRLVTNGTARYCMTAQEDNASLEALLRADLAGRADFARVILMRTASDFDRPPPDVSVQQNLLFVPPDGYPIALENLYRAGIAIVNDIRANWKRVYKAGIKPSNYIGDILDSLDGAIPPNFGP